MGSLSFWLKIWYFAKDNLEEKFFLSFSPDMNPRPLTNCLYTPTDLEMEFVAPIIEAVVGSLIFPVKKHLGFFVSSTKLVEEMRGRIRQLNVTAKDVQKKKDAADAYNQVVSEHVVSWLDDVKEMNISVQGIPTTGIRCFNVAKRYKAGKRSFDIVKELDDLEARISKIEWTKEQIPLGMVPSTAAPVHDGTQISFKSRDLVFKAALKSLQPDNETQKIALCGMGGVGKTTMMELLKEAAVNSKMFDWVAKVVIGENPDPIAIQQAIADYMGGEGLTETTKDARADRLRNIFAEKAQNGKKVLVIMDDLWKEVDLKDVGLASPLPNGFKLLFTSRDEAVCTRMGVNTESIFKVGVLDYEEAKTLFFGIVGPSDGNNLQKIGEKIVKECRGLPIAIKTIANSLRDNIKEAWIEALSHLRRGDLQDIVEIVDRVFELSYNKLKHDDAKAIFLLSGIFPDDHDIPIEDLVMYGWGLKLFTEVYNIREARRRTNTCVNNLIRANLLTKSDREGCVKMHDLARAFVLSNFSKVKQASVVNHDDMARLLTKDANESYDRILLRCTGMSEFPADFNYPNLSLLILNDGDKLKFPPVFYEGMKKLEVVSYEYMHTPLLPTTFEHSSQLRTLCLHSCSLMGDLSFLGSLSNLETLSLAGCSIEKLPWTIGNLRKLKLLALTDCGDLFIDDGVFQNLVSLEELYMRASYGRDIKFTDANCAELEILSQHLFALEMEFFENKPQPKQVSLQKLERFRISIGCRLKDYTLDNLEMYIIKNRLRLVGDCKELVECKINELFEKTEELSLWRVKNMNHLGDVSMHPSQLSFCNLRELEVCWCPDMKYLFTLQVAIGLKKLERLSVVYCPLLEVVVGGNSVVERDSQPSLGFQFHNLKEIIFPNLDFLSLGHLPCLKGIGGTGDTSSSSTTTSVNNQFQGTQVISATWPLCQYPRRLTLWSWRAWSSSIIACYVVLKDLKHRDDHTQSIPSNVLLQLTKLEHIELGYNELAEQVFEVIPEGTNDNNTVGFSESQTVFNIPNLRDLEIQGMNNLRYLWKRNQWMVLEFPKLKTLYITGCRSLEHVFTYSMVGSLVQLQILSIGYCQNLELIVKEEDRDVRVNDQIIRLPHLKALTLSYLPSLEGFCLGKEAFSWPSLDTLEIERCPAITVLTKGQLDTPALKVIDTSFGKCDIREDLNSFIKTKQEEVPTCCL
ncbi:NB-ARC domains-containing protein [Artemisia annua]|uniref:NB-ARC domains-containing protein n=1 Tax=Artemisia annua TaxID=35608 RepID=A0A2U1QEL1_ARTAN|nr:NB-ARC domains-containing protein [Artemisia annua]